MFYVQFDLKKLGSNVNCNMYVKLIWTTEQQWVKREFSICRKGECGTRFVSTGRLNTELNEVRAQERNTAGRS